MTKTERIIELRRALDNSIGDTLTVGRLSFGEMVCPALRLAGVNLLKLVALSPRIQKFMNSFATFSMEESIGVEFCSAWPRMHPEESNERVVARRNELMNLATQAMSD